MGSSSSMLTQYDIEEVQEHCNTSFSQQEIVALYQRFCQLDRKGGGFITAEEFMSVPEFAVNPLSQRLLRILDGLNFKEFVAFLSAFSSRASLQQKVEFIFRVYDSDGSGKVTFSCMLDVLRDLTGQFISEQQREACVCSCREYLLFLWDSILTVAAFVDLGSSRCMFLVQEVLLALLLGDSILSVTVLRCCRHFLLQVLTQVLEEAGYKKDSSLDSSDFMKILGYSGLKMEVDVPVD